MQKYFTLAFFLIPITWAGSFIAGKIVVAEVDPFSSVFWRFFLSAIIILPALIIFQRKKHPPLFQKDFIFHLSIVVLTSGVGYHILFFMALQYTTPTNTALIIALNPFFTAVAEAFIFKYKRRIRFYIGFLLAFSGAMWVNFSRGSGITKPGVGEILCLLASLSWSAYTITAKMTKKQEWDALWLNGYNYLFTALIILPFVPSVFKMQATWNAWTGLWYMAIFPTAIGYTLFYIGVQKKGPAWASTFIYLVPSFTANLDHVFFDAPFTSSLVLGTTLVVIGLIYGNMTQQQMNYINKHYLKYLLKENK